MPQNTTLQVGTSWMQLTDANVTEITFQNVGWSAIYVLGTVGASAPGAEAKGLLYRPGEGEGNKALADLFPGLSGVNRVYVKSASTATEVFVSHA